MGGTFWKYGDGVTLTTKPMSRTLAATYALQSSA